MEKFFLDPLVQHHTYPAPPSSSHGLHFSNTTWPSPRFSHMPPSFSPQGAVAVIAVIFTVYTHRHTHTHTDTDTDTHTHTHRHTHRQTDRHTHIHIHTHRHTDRQTDRQTHTHTHTHTQLQRPFAALSFCLAPITSSSDIR